MVVVVFMVNILYNPYLLFNEKLKQISTSNAVESHIDTKLQNFKLSD